MTEQQPREIPPEVIEAARLYLTRMVRNLTGVERICPGCGGYLIDCHKHGRAVYGDPCGCRMWTGALPNWAKAKGEDLHETARIQD